MLVAARSAARTGARAAAGSGAARALGGVGVPTAPGASTRLNGAVCERRDALSSLSGLSPIGRGFAWLGVVGGGSSGSGGGGGGCGGGGGGLVRAPAATRALSSSRGVGGGDSRAPRSPQPRNPPQAGVPTPLSPPKDMLATQRRAASGAAKEEEEEKEEDEEEEEEEVEKKEEKKEEEVRGVGAGVGRKSVSPLNNLIRKTATPEDLLRLVAGACTRPLCSST